MRYATSLLVLVVLAAPAAAQERLPTEAEMKAALELAAPGPEHARLAKLVGTWDLDFKIATGPTTSLTSRGVAENRMVLGGRFLISEAKSTEAIMGQMIEGMTIYGFDRRANTYTVLGLDNFGTYYVEAEGAATADAQNIVMPGIEIDPRTKKEEKYDMILRIVDADTYVTAVVFKLAGGVEAKAVEVTHRRRK